jgi:alpha-methylacyl-CoA racemase
MCSRVDRLGSSRHDRPVTTPLKGLRVVELGGIGPVPYAAMLLAEAGAEVLRLTRPDAPAGLGTVGSELLLRSRVSIGVDLKTAGGMQLALDLVGQADALVEGFRPGVAERMGLGPEECREVNPRLVYGRMTGWGQEGPWAGMAGHDINYISVAGALWAIGREGERPVPPLNLVADFGGGGMMLAFGVVSALLEAGRSGQGKVVDAAMLDGSASLMTMLFSHRAYGVWKDERGVNVLDTGAPFYEVYETRDGQYFAVGAIEPQFYAELVKRLGLDVAQMPAQLDRTHWRGTKERFAAIFRTKTRAEWTAVFDGVDACATPVLSPAEAYRHPHVAERGTYVEIDGTIQPAAVPRFGGTQNESTAWRYLTGDDADAVLSTWGLADSRLAELHQDGSLA